MGLLGQMVPNATHGSHGCIPAVFGPERHPVIVGMNAVKYVLAVAQESSTWSTAKGYLMHSLVALHVLRTLLAEPIVPIKSRHLMFVDPDRNTGRFSPVSYSQDKVLEIHPDSLWPLATSR